MLNWTSVVVFTDCSLEKAISKLEQCGSRILLVTDQKYKLLGTLTDGDVRRAILGHASLESLVTQHMNSDPRKGELSWNSEYMRATMNKFGILHLPVVNEQGIVEGIFSLDEIINKPKLDTPIFIMAGGFGKRLKPLTDHCPKPMLKVGGKPMLENIITNLSQAGFHRFFISTYFMKEVIENYFGNGKKWGVSIQYVNEDKPLDTGGALGLLPHDQINEPMIMMNGDLLTTLDFKSLLDFHNTNNAVATMAVHEFEYQVPYGVIISENGKVKSIVEKPVNKYFVNTGIYLLEPRLIKNVDAGIRIDMPTLLNRYISEGETINIFPVHEYWLDIGRIDDFERAQSVSALKKQS